MDNAAILVGSETGTGEDVSDQLAAALEEIGLGMEFVNMEESLSKGGATRSSSSMLSARCWVD